MVYDLEGRPLQVSGIALDATAPAELRSAPAASMRGRHSGHQNGNAAQNTSSAGKRKEQLSLLRRPQNEVNTMKFGHVLLAALGLIVIAAVVSPPGTNGALAQALPNPYRIVDGWAQLPKRPPMGAVGKVAIDPDGRHIWAVIRCDPLADPARFGDECRDSKADSVYKFSPDGKVVDELRRRHVHLAARPRRRPRRQRLGDRRGRRQAHAERRQARTAGREVQSRRQGADDARRSRASPEPARITSRRRATSSWRPSGDIFVADGHNENGNNRVVKFSKDGKFIKAWGKTGYAPGEFRTLHAIAMDSRGRIFVGDRVEQPDPALRPGREVPDAVDAVRAAERHLLRHAGIRFTWPTRNPTMCRIRAGRWASGSATPGAAGSSTFIQYPWGDPRETPGNGAEFVAVDRDGNLYGGEPRPKKLQKYVRVRP